MSKVTISRRSVLVGAATAAAAQGLARGQSSPAPSPNMKLNIAGIGIGGQGQGDLGALASENIVALCDVNDAHAGPVFDRYPNAKRYRDYREMLEKQQDIDAVVIATPDHTHAVITLAAIRAGKHVYCEKPLTHTVHEARMVAMAAREAGVATQMGNQGQASEEARILREMVADGAIGKLREIHGWSNRYPRISPRGMGRPQGSTPVPDTLDWDLWLGPAPYRPYVEGAYLPFRWRGWWDFGSGVLGDIGCHNFAAIFKALDLGYPTSVEATSTAAQSPPEVRMESAPEASIVRFEFAPGERHDALTLSWYDGGLMPPRPDELESDREMGGGDGMLYVGDKGKILNHRIIPETKMQDYGRPPQLLERSPGHHQEWIDACKGGAPAGSNFDFAGPLTETVLLGNIALKRGKKLYFDGERFTNDDEANALLHSEYREGWSLT